MMLAEQQAQLVRLVHIRERRIDRAVALLRQRHTELDKRRTDQKHCEALISRLNNEHRELRLAKTSCATASAADWMQQEQYGHGLQHRILEQRNRLTLLEKEVKNAESAVEQAKQQLRTMRQKLQALSAQANYYGEQVRREKSQKEQRNLDEQALGAAANGRME